MEKEKLEKFKKILEEKDFFNILRLHEFSEKKIKGYEDKVKKMKDPVMSIMHEMIDMKVMAYHALLSEGEIDETKVFSLTEGEFVTEKTRVRQFDMGLKGKNLLRYRGTEWID